MIWGKKKSVHLPFYFVVDCLITLQGPRGYLSKRIAERGLTINHDVLKKLHGAPLQNSAK